MKRVLPYLVLALAACGIPNDLPDDFRERAVCIVGTVQVHTETEVDCGKVERNVTLARRMYAAMGLPEVFSNLEIRIWNRQILLCDQYFLGACVHFVKGESYGGDAQQWVELNNGGELLLHELLHFAQTPRDPDHRHWGTNGFAFADWVFRQHAECLTGDR